MNKQSNFASHILSPISLGELLDKITILEIKREHMTNQKLENVIKEHQFLQKVLNDQNLEVDLNLFQSLKEINHRLWGIEDEIRIKERNQEFDLEFIELARSVYKVNDKRAEIKRKINEKYNSYLVEEKQYN
ncbi:DUF6165 family protein [Prochlorococcus marinus]|uniref:DUF6165 family protein n=1 Tax=Prochlorococcus marinus TaxID=1219 RepID=UPI0022B2B52D|nr:DUF6165 family protein [Prochlorococcus marinus]